MTDRPAPIYWDPFDEVIDESPHEIWRRMRDEMPLYRNDKYDFWALSRHADVHAAHVDPQTYLSGYGTVLELMGTDMSGTGQIIFMDGQQHTKMRVLVSKAFTRGRVAALEDRIRQFCTRTARRAGRQRRLRLRRRLRRPAAVAGHLVAARGLAGRPPARTRADQHDVPHRARRRDDERGLVQRPDRAARLPHRSAGRPAPHARATTSSPR